MDKLSSYFGFTEQELANALYLTKGFISGSSALNTFLNKDEEKDSWTFASEQDLDIFIRVPYSKENHYSKSNVYYPFDELAKDKFETLFFSKGYIKEDRNLQYKNRFQLSYANKDVNELEYHKSALSYYIKSITNYIKDDKKIQIIILYDCSIKEFIDTFDLNICKIVITSARINKTERKLKFYHELDENFLTSLELYMIKENLMYVCNPLYPPNLKKRLVKYIKRGFTLINPENFFNSLKPKEISIEEAASKHAYIITYEDFVNNKTEEQSISK